MLIGLWRIWVSWVHRVAEHVDEFGAGWGQIG